MPIHLQAMHVLGREREIELLKAFVTPDATGLARHLIVQGYKSGGKTHLVLQHLQSINVKYTLIQCEECITDKLLLQRCLNGIKRDSGIDLSAYNQTYMYKGTAAARVSVLCQRLAYFLHSLEQFYKETGYSDRHLLVLDNFDRRCDPSGELLAEFLQMEHFAELPNLLVIYIVSGVDPMESATFAIPRIQFAPHSQEQIAAILSNMNLYAADNPHFWRSFAELITTVHYDFFGPDLAAYVDLCHRIWPLFAERLDQGDVVKIFRDVREEMLSERVLCDAHVEQYGEVEARLSAPLLDLLHHSKFILLASYLALYVDPKHDMQLFSRVGGSKRRERKGEKAKKEIDPRLLSAASFDPERVKAILSVIYRNESATLNVTKDYPNLFKDLTQREIAKKEVELANFTMNNTIDLDVQLATLLSLGLLLRSYNTSLLNSRMRFKCNVSWDVVSGLAEELNFPLHHYLVEKG